MVTSERIKPWVQVAKMSFLSGHGGEIMCTPGELEEVARESEVWASLLRVSL